MSSFSSSTTRGVRKKPPFQDVQHYYDTLQTYLNDNNNNNTCTYIKNNLSKDVANYLLSFEPDTNNKYQQFTHLYNKCAEIIISLIKKYPNNYYDTLLGCLKSLLGFDEQFECYIFKHYNNYNKANICNNDDLVFNYVYNNNNVNNCQLLVIDTFCKHYQYFMN
eukprot:330926_1